MFKLIESRFGFLIVLSSDNTIVGCIDTVSKEEDQHVVADVYVGVNTNLSGKIFAAVLAWFNISYCMLNVKSLSDITDRELHGSLVEITRDFMESHGDYFETGRWFGSYLEFLNAHVW